MISVVGVSHRGAGLGARERLRVAESTVREAQRAREARGAPPELVVLSTCNRTEVYVASAREADAEEAWSQLTGTGWIPGRFVHRGVDAVRHLLEVASGLDSAMLGDQQILGQVRAAKATAAHAGTLGSQLHEAFSLAIAAARRSRRETTIGAGAPGIGAAVARALSRNGVGPDEPVAVLGAGTAAQGVAKHLQRAGFTELAFLTRSGSSTVAQRFGGRAVPWSALDDVLASATTVIAATGAAEPVLTVTVLQRALANRRSARRGPLLVVDVGMPRNVEPCGGVAVLDLDDLSRHAASDAARREAAVPAVRAIIDEQVAGWEQRRAAEPVERAIKALYLESRATATRLAHELAGDLATVEEAERIVRRTLNAMLHDHVGRLRELAPMEG